MDRFEGEMGLRNEFLVGAVEGFYGRPWTGAQRLQLFRQLSAWGLNTYFYAPKDDLKHRAIWREAYQDSELSELAELVSACRAAGLYFIYGLSPGLDIQYSDSAERDHIKRRFAQLLEIGCEHFSLLFDDLPGTIATADRQTFNSVADAQSEVANDIHDWVRSHIATARFLFCPTAYCDRMDRARLAGQDYLETIGERLEPSIDVLWTGPEIVSPQISIESINSLAARIQRRPMIWDNLHANDYDGQRLYTGPYAGRPVELKQHVAGIVLNPNNEFPVNHVPLRTLASYRDADDRWSPREAFLSATAEWLAEFETVGPPFTLDDLIVLCDCYYLPHEYGPGAHTLYDLAERLISCPVDRWNGADVEFDKFNQRIQSTFDKLTQLRNRELFYAWSRRVWDLKEELQLIDGFLAHKKVGTQLPEILTHLPSTYRGGIVGRLRGLLSMDNQGRFAATRQS